MTRGIRQQLVTELAQLMAIARQLRRERLELVKDFGLPDHRGIESANHFEEMRVGGFSIQNHRAWRAEAGARQTRFRERTSAR